jgi:hypothetical protein
MGRTTINLNIAHIMLPSIENILNFAEADMLQTNNHAQAVDLHRLDELVERADSRSNTQRMDTAKIMTTLRDGAVKQKEISWVWFIVIIMISIGSGALWHIWGKIVKRCCPVIWKCMCNLRPNATSLVHKLHEPEIVLQNLPREDGVENRNYVPGLFQRQS